MRMTIFSHKEAVYDDNGSAHYAFHVFRCCDGNVPCGCGILIKYAIDKHKEKKRKKNEESADKAE